jgi:hypothetical protein
MEQNKKQGTGASNGCGLLILMGVGALFIAVLITAILFLIFT